MASEAGESPPQHYRALSVHGCQGERDVVVRWAIFLRTYEVHGWLKKAPGMYKSHRLKTSHSYGPGPQCCREQVGVLLTSSVACP